MFGEKTQIITTYKEKHMAYNINDFPPVCGMIHLNMVPEEMGFVLCSETGNVINWYWISGAQANGGRDQMGLLEPGGRGP